MKIDQSVVNKALKEIEKTTERYRPRLEAAIAQIVNKESAVVGKTTKEFLDANNIPAFNARLEDYYGRGGPFQRMVKKTIGPVIRDFMELAQTDALDAVTFFSTVPRGEAFVNRYTRYYALRHASSSKRQLEKIVREAGKPKAGKVKEAVSLRAMQQVTNLPSLEVWKRINEWKIKRAKTIAEDESIRQSNAIARETWRTSGVTKLKWRVTSSKPCPFCAQLNGKTVGIRQPFLEDGETLYAPYEKKE